MLMRRFSTGFTAVMVALTAAGSLLLWPGSALAHNSLVEAVPAKESVLTAAPAEVTLRFLATLKPDTQLTVTDARGVSAIGAPTVSGKVITAPFTATAGGVYTVGYGLVSADGHAIENTYTFTLQGAAPEATAPATPTAKVTTAAPELVQATPMPRNEGRRWIVFIGGAAVAGLLTGGVIAFLRRRRS